MAERKLTIEQKRRTRIVLHAAASADITSTDIFEPICDDAFEEDGEAWSELHERLQEYAHRVITRLL